ncbi:MAG: transcription-repair coupling factor [Chlamydiia bacterium]|nr:transcription-repair coupling factor [Chlamydiia bacterium]
MDPKLNQSLLAHLKIKEFIESIKKGYSLVTDEVWEGPKALLASLVCTISQKHTLILTSGENRFLMDLPFFFDGSVVEFPAWECLPEEEIPPSPDVVGQRYNALRQIQHSQSPLIILTSLPAILQKLIPKNELNSLHLILKKGETFSFDTLPVRLSEMGYHRRLLVSDKGEYAVRGGIMDIFPVGLPDPYRIEFFEDKIESIRRFDPTSQTSIEKVEELMLTPGQELELLARSTQLTTIFDYLGDFAAVIIDDLLTLEDKATSLGALTASKFRAIASLTEILKQIEPLQTVYFSNHPLEELGEILPKEDNIIQFEILEKSMEAKRWRSPFLPLFPTFCPPEQKLEAFHGDDLLQALSPFSSSEMEIFFASPSQSEETEIQRKIEKMKIRLPPKHNYIQGYLSSGFYLEENQVALIPSPELTHRYRIHRQKQRSYYHALPVHMFTLTPGEAVVHQSQGIGKYLGVETRPNHMGIETEFLLLEYAQGGKLFVPMDQSSDVSKYIGATDELPELHTLGSSRWQKAKQRTEKAILSYAQDLIKLEAQRELKGGFVYPQNSDLVTQFAEEFPYIETEDQLAALNHISNDMTSKKAMNRLVCGDVGYGKTEVAMRAAFKAVVDGNKQVAVLVPTTVLAMQHFETFSERMAGYPVHVGILSRFRTPKQQKETLEKLASGQIDIVIGTHRLVSPDVIFKDLGLIIIDEEQRFGVKAKEHLKKAQQEVDCLTLSATPIPRTLYLSLVGAREMSLINTPPEDRLPIQTIIASKSDQVVKTAILRELARDGQVFYIHNRVETIFDVSGTIRKLVPEARIVVGHGQMSSKELDEIFHAFKTGKANILIATTIIENGIDIPNANTILIDRADQFGLADLYQIRGRVGRWNKKAYCYFLVNNLSTLSEISRKRLSALASASGHGGGMKVAMHDLEIRGAGNILGTEQSGHISTIGFSLYCKMLKKTIRALKNKQTEVFSTDVKIEFPYDARLPTHYVNEIELRLELYGRLGEIETHDEITALFQEIEDRFGLKPPEVRWLEAIAHLKLFAASNQFTHLTIKKRLLEARQEHGKKRVLHKRIEISSQISPETLFIIITNTLKTHFPVKHHFT